MTYYWLLPTDITYKEVYIYCFKVFRLIHDFIRHTEQYNDIAERKSAYLKNTCDELHNLSDKKLDHAIIQALSDAEGKKRTWVTAFGSQTSVTHAGFGRSDIAAIDQTCHQVINSNDPLHYLDPASIEPPEPLIQSPTAQPQLASVPNSVISSIYLDSSIRIQLYTTEGQAQG